MSVLDHGVAPIGGVCGGCIYGPRPVVDPVDVFALGAMSLKYGAEQIWICGRTLSAVRAEWRGCGEYEPKNGAVLEPFFPSTQRRTA